MNPHNYISRFQKSIYAQSIRRGLTLAIPFLIMGSFALLFLNFPSDTYQRYLEAWMNGALTDILTTVYSISLGSLALVLIITISLSYGLLAGHVHAVPSGRYKLLSGLLRRHNGSAGLYL